MEIETEKGIGWIRTGENVTVASIIDATDSEIKQVDIEMIALEVVTGEELHEAKRKAKTLQSITSKLKEKNFKYDSFLGTWQKYYWHDDFKDGKEAEAFASAEIKEILS